MKMKKIMDYEIPEKKDIDKKGSIARTAWKFLAVFLVFMILFSVVNRSVSSLSVAVVTVAKPRTSVLENSFSVDGTVGTNQDVAVSVVPGIKVDSVNAIAGKETEKGDILFTLDKESLQEEFLKAKNEYEELRLGQEDAEINNKEAERKKQLNLTRAEEDYEIELRKTNKEVSDAWKKVEEAKSKMNSFVPVSQSSSSQSAEEPGNMTDSSFTDGNSDFNENEQSTDPVFNQLKANLENARNAEVFAQQEMEYAGNLIYNAVAKFEDDFDYYDPDKITVFTYSDQQMDYNRRLCDMIYAASGNMNPAGTTSADPVIKAQMEDIRQSVINSLMAGDASYQSKKAAYSDALTRSENAKSALDQYQASKAADTSVQIPDTAEDSGVQASREAYSALVEAYNSAYETYLTAVQQARDFDVTGKRSIEDQQAPEDSKKSQEYTAKTNLELKKLEYERWKKLKDINGEIKAEASGTIKDVKVTTGDTTPDGVSVLIGDRSSGYVFSGTVTKDQTQYIKVGSTVNLETIYQGQTVTVQAVIDEVNNSTDNSDQYQVRASVTDKDRNMGSQASIKVENKSEKYNTVVPNSAVHRGDGKDYVLVVRESKGILGTTLTVEKAEVTVQGKDESNSAVQGETLDYNSQVVVSSNRTLSAGDRVRLSEQ